MSLFYCPSLQTVSPWHGFSPTIGTPTLHFPCSRIERRVWAWWCSAITPALSRLRQDDQEFEASLDGIAGPCFQKRTKKMTKGNLWVAGEAGGRFRILEMAKVRKLLTKPRQPLQQPASLSPHTTPMSRELLVRPPQATWGHPLAITILTSHCTSSISSVYSVPTGEKLRLLAGTPRTWPFSLEGCLVNDRSVADLSEWHSTQWDHHCAFARVLDAALTYDPTGHIAGRSRV